MRRGDLAAPHRCITMNPLHWIEYRRYRKLWSDPLRSLQTLESFAETEEDGGKDLVAAARRVTDPDMLLHLQRHAGDEIRHARLFRERAADVATAQGRSLGLKEQAGRAYDLSGRRGEQVDAHGFFSAGLYDELGEVEYVCMVNVAEKKAAHIFELHQKAAMAAGDAATAEVFGQILHDEKYHVAWTGTFLKKWRKEGREAEVSRAVRRAKRGRFLESWRALGLRSASGFATILLMVCYWTVLAPFGLLARRSRADDFAGWRAAGEAARLSSQY